jgi:hypothetical protein
MHRIPFVLLTVLAACKPGERAGEPAPDGGQCAEALVTVDVRDSSEHWPDATSVSWSTRDSHTDCETADERVWTCTVTADEAGATVAASRDGYATAQAELETDGGCVVDQEVALVLEPAGTHFAENRTYYVQLIENEYDCEHSWELYEMNCYRTAEFCADGYAEIVVTDIFNGGVYELRDGGLHVTTTAGGDLPDDPVFEVLSDSELRDTWLGETWKLDLDGKLPYSHCR